MYNNALHQHLSCQGEPVTIVPGDYVIFPDGLKSVWQVTKTLKKHYMHF